VRPYTGMHVLTEQRQLVMSIY